MIDKLVNEKGGTYVFDDFRSDERGGAGREAELRRDPKR